MNRCRDGGVRALQTFAKLGLRAAVAWGGAVTGMAIGCVALLGAVSPVRAQIPTVYAAASLTSVLQELMKEAAAKRGLRARFSFAGSSALARQIVEGAPADVYFSANAKWMDYLEGEGMIVGGTRVDLLGNGLVIVAPEGEGFGVEARKGFDLAGAFAGRLAVGDPDHVPAGMYARQALEWLGWWAALEKRLAPAPDVRAALAYVERGQCAAGVVYATDAAVSARVEVVARLPKEAHEPIVYPMAAVAGGDTTRAEELLEFFRSDAAAAVFARHGFTVLEMAAAEPDSTQ